MASQQPYLEVEHALAIKSAIKLQYTTKFILIKIGPFSDIDLRSLNLWDEACNL